jgi:hypothetical protein
MLTLTILILAPPLQIWRSLLVVHGRGGTLRNGDATKRGKFNRTASAASVYGVTRRITTPIADIAILHLINIGREA